MPEKRPERRRQPPVSKTWFNGVAASIVTGLFLASWGGVYAFGQVEGKTTENADSIERLYEAQARDRVRVNDKFEDIDEKLAKGLANDMAQQTSDQAILRELRNLREDIRRANAR